MNAPQQAIIFDWNGTLVDDASVIVAGTNATLALYGLAPVDLKRYQDVYTIPLANMYRALGCSEEIIVEQKDEIIRVFEEFYEKAVATIQARNGARRTLAYIQKQGHKAAILSNYTIPNITKLAKRLGVLEHFDTILANGKTLDKPFVSCDKGNRLDNYFIANDIQKAIIVGDSIEEIDIAQQRGLVSVAITDGTCSAARLKEAKPDFLISSLEEIPAIAQKVFG